MDELGGSMRQCAVEPQPHPNQLQLTAGMGVGGLVNV